MACCQECNLYWCSSALESHDVVTVGYRMWELSGKCACPVVGWWITDRWFDLRVVTVTDVLRSAAGSQQVHVDEHLP